MPASVASPSDVVNLALAKIGYKLRVGASLYEGSRHAIAALAVYAETRDEALRAYDWNFAEQIAVLALTGQAAPTLWALEYTYPATCLKIRELYSAVAIAADPNNPLPPRWIVGNTAVSGKVIWSNLAAATAVFTAQITDPTKWEPLFVDALTDRLAPKLSPLVEGMDVLKLAAEREKMALPLAEGMIG